MIIHGKILGIHHLIEVTVQEGVIKKIEPSKGGKKCDIGGSNFYISSGFFDPQVNGFAGIDFNNPSLTIEGVHKAAESIALHGVTHFFPTIITASHEKIINQLKILSEAFEKDILFREMCPGIHLEGPYISPKDGPRGIHPKIFIRPPKWEEVEKFQEVCDGRIRIITLAPELEGAIPFIEKAVKEGIVIAIGHTEASEEVIEESIRAGARLSTHLGNGVHNFLHRHRNPIQKQLAHDELMASIIVDGIHVPDYVVKNYVRAKGIDRVILTTDSIAGAGAPIGSYTLGDLEIEVGKDRVARLRGTQYLSGSTVTMDEAINNLINFTKIELESAIQIAVKNGEKLFPDIKGEIIQGQTANLVIFEYEKKIKVKSTWIKGEIIRKEDLNG